MSFGKTHVLVSVFVWLGLLTFSFATVGVDVSQPVSESQWKCLQSPGGQGSVDFAVVRVYESVGRVDSSGVSTIKAARNAGVRFVDGYLFPCVPSGRCPSPEQQVNATVFALERAGASIGSLWYDVEPLSWSKDHGENQEFLKRMIDAGRAHNVKAGIYTNWNSWSEIMGEWSYPHDQGLPVWYPHYDGSKSFSDFQSFGGWAKPNIKQYLGDKSSCSAGVDYNWYP